MSDFIPNALIFGHSFVRCLHDDLVIHWSIEIPGPRPPGVCGDYASSALQMT